MTDEEAIEYNENLKAYMRITDKNSEYKFLEENYEALDMGIKALEQISYLTDRPCSVCEFHTENGCSKWNCVFEQQQDKVIHNHPCEDCYYNDGDVHAECVVCNKAESEGK